jgi:hypothetical protein
MTAKVIQGSFFAGQPKLPPVQPRMNLNAATRGSTPAFAARLPGPPVPAFGGRPMAVQRHDSGGSFAVDAVPLGLA